MFRICTRAPLWQARLWSELSASVFAVLLFLVLGFFSSYALAAPPPEIEWEKIETPHFTIVYDSRQYELAALYAKFAEQSWASTSPVFGVWPEKTVLLIDDSTDIANGFATGVPYPLVSTYPVLPLSLDSISDYGNWGLELVTHEYTHILNFEPATGVMKPLRYMFGSIIRPNILLPRWYSEGLATEMETRLSSYGRLRSPNYLSIVRSMVQDKTLRDEDISRINETSIPGWPGGVRPYLMGAMLWSEMMRLGGESTARDLNLAYSSRIPFFLNGPVESRLGTDYAGLLGKVYDRAEEYAGKQLSIIAMGGTFEETPLEQEGFFNHSPVVSPDKSRLAYVGKLHNVDSVIYVAERDGQNFKKAGRVTDNDSINRVSWTPDSKALIFDAVDTYKRYYEYADLYRYDFDSRKTKQLTRGLRAREPVVSPDGKWIAFVQNTPGSTRLGAVQIDGSAPSVVYEPPIQTRIARPEFLSSGEIIFTEKRDDGAEVLKVAKVRTGTEGRLSIEGEPRVVLRDFKPVHYPRMTSEGLLFVSDRSGVANLYLADKTLTTARAVSNTTTRLMTGDLDPVTGDLVYGKLTSYGPQIARSPRKAWSEVPPALPQVAPLVDSEWPQFQEPQVNVEIKREKYRPYYHLLPRYWLPFVYFVPGGTYFQASTAGNDATSRHSYSLTAAYDTLSAKTSFLGSYTNASTPVRMSLAGMNLYEYVYTDGLIRHTASVSAEGSSYIPGLSNNWRASLGWKYSQTEAATRSLKRNGAGVGLSYMNASRRGFEISPEKGGSFSLDYTRYFPGISDNEYEQIDFGAAKYFSKWLPDRHAMAFFLNASIAPRLNGSLFGQTTIGGNYQAALTQRGLIMRGYQSGAFIGKNLITASAEYRFPLSYTYRGFGTAPFFIQRWHGAAFVDALTLDGFSYDFEARRRVEAKLGKVFLGTGVEARADTTVFYHVPIQFIFGLYYGADAQTNPYGLFPFIGLGM